MSNYQVFIDCFPGDSSIYINRLVSIDVSANILTFEGRLTITNADLPHEYRMTLWENETYVSYNTITVLTINRVTPEDQPEQISITYEITRPLGL
jgi:hypothetical protein